MNLEYGAQLGLSSVSLRYFIRLQPPHLCSTEITLEAPPDVECWGAYPKKRFEGAEDASCFTLCKFSDKSTSGPWSPEDMVAFRKIVNLSEYNSLAPEGPTVFWLAMSPLRKTLCVERTKGDKTSDLTAWRIITKEKGQLALVTKWGDFVKVDEHHQIYIDKEADDQSWWVPGYLDRLTPIFPGNPSLCYKFPPARILAQEAQRSFDGLRRVDDPTLDCRTEASLRDQEQLVIEDLLALLVGSRSRCLLSDPDLKRMHPPFREIFKTVFGLANKRDTVAQTVDRLAAFGAGRVCHAFSGSLSQFLEDMDQEVSMMEERSSQEQFTLMDVLHGVGPLLERFTLFDSLCRPVLDKGLRGASLIDHLLEYSQRYNRMDEPGKIMEILGVQAINPYLKMLESWMGSGVLDDPYHEFLVERDAGEGTDLKYAQNSKNLPVFLGYHAEKIVDAGRYIDIIHSLWTIYPSLSVITPGSTWEDLPPLEVKDLKSLSRLYRGIDQAFRRASTKVLTVFMGHPESPVYLPAFLDGLNSVFFHGKGDYVATLLMNCKTLLMKNQKDISFHESLTRLNLGLQMAMKNSAVQNMLVGLHACFNTFSTYDVRAMTITPSQDDPDILSSRIHSDSKIVSSLTLGLVPNWPFSFFLRDHTLIYYQTLFRQLFLAKHLEFRLSNLFLKKLSIRRLPSDFSRRFAAIRFQMLSFVRGYISYLSFDVVQPNFARLLQAVTNIEHETIDTLFTKHESMLNDCLVQSLISHESLLYQELHKTLGVCNFFCDWGEQLLNSSQGTTLEFLDQAEYHCLTAHQRFNDHVFDLLESLRGRLSLRHESFLINLKDKLDFNGYLQGVTTT